MGRLATHTGGVIVLGGPCTLLLVEHHDPAGTLLYRLGVDESKACPEHAAWVSTQDGRDIAECLGGRE